ncbi:MAG: cytochrome c nitrite reductase small subunit [Bacteroidales bacterium]|nr:cytochrome c nitrite reductase small subunit [Bacteroidales bacterium]
MSNNWLKIILPPENWRLPVAIALGAFMGLFIYLFIVSNAVSYISDDPKTCINCHVMEPEYVSWFHSSHREVTNCNDCHVPQDNFMSKYYFKAKDGLRHATVFTLRNEPQVIHIKEEGLNVVQENCKRCHSFVNENVATLNIDGHNYNKGEGKLCWECHREVPHGRVTSLSASPNAISTKK